MTNEQALERIWGILNLEDPDYQWSPDELDAIADVMLQWKTPEQGDYVFSDTGALGSRTLVSVYGEGWIGDYPDEEEAIKDVKQLMDEDAFYPSVWRLSDHGDYHPMTLD